MKLLLQLPVWLILLIRLAIWNDGSKVRRPVLYDPIKELQDEFDTLSDLKDVLNDWMLSAWARNAIQHRMHAIAADIVLMRNLNVAAAGFIPKSK